MCFAIFSFLFIIYFFIFITWFSFFRRQKSLFTYCSSLFMHFSCIVYGTYNPFIQKKNIKNGSYSTIHTFTNYFVTVFSIFIFSKNKLYQNEVQNFWRPCLLFRSPRDTARDQVHVWWSHSFWKFNQPKSPILKVKDAEPTLINMSRWDWDFACTSVIRLVACTSVS